MVSLVLIPWMIEVTDTGRKSILTFHWYLLVYLWKKKRLETKDSWISVPEARKYYLAWILGTEIGEGWSLENCKAAEEAAAKHIFLLFLNVEMPEEKDISHSADWQ